jgi:hypothetical protein
MLMYHAKTASIHMVSPEHIKEFSLRERQLVWFDRIKESPQDPSSIQGLLFQGYELFFESLEPLKKTESFKTSDPNEIGVVWHDSRSDERLKEFRDLFGPYNYSWGIQVYGYEKAGITDGEEIAIRLRCGQQGSHGERIIKAYWNSRKYLTYPKPEGQMRLMDVRSSWIRPDTDGRAEVDKERNLSDYPALKTCKLAIVLADVFVEAYQGNRKTV